MRTATLALIVAAVSSFLLASVLLLAEHRDGAFVVFVVSAVLGTNALFCGIRTQDGA